MEASTVTRRRAYLGHFGLLRAQIFAELIASGHLRRKKRRIAGRSGGMSAAILLGSTEIMYRAGDKKTWGHKTVQMELRNCTTSQSRCRPNPDFEPALQRCRAAEAAWTARPSNARYLAVMTCNKYPDGSYIPAVICKDITNPQRSRTSSLSPQNSSITKNAGLRGTARSKGSVSIAGDWAMLPGSYFTEQVTDVANLEQTRQANAGSVSMKQIGPGQFKYFAGGTNGWDGMVTLTGSDDKASGDRNVVIGDSSGVGSKDDIDIHVEASLSESKLYVKESWKYTRTSSGRVGVYYKEVYTIAASTRR